MHILFCVHRWLKGLYTVDLHQHSYTLMSRSKALWDTFNSSRKHSKCRKHSSNRRNSNKGNTNIPKTRLAVFQTSEICWLGSAVDCVRAARSPSVLSPCRRQHVVALGSQTWRQVLQECLKDGESLLVTLLLIWSCSFRVSRCIAHWSENHKQRLPRLDVTCGDLRRCWTFTTGPVSPQLPIGVTAGTSGSSELSRRNHFQVYMWKFFI